jgi:hypothetical protein
MIQTPESMKDLTLDKSASLQALSISVEGDINSNSAVSSSVSVGSWGSPESDPLSDPHDILPAHSVLA